MAGIICDGNNPLKIGLPDVKETHGIVADCVWSFPCLADPGGVCPGGASACRQVGTDRFQCECDRGEEGCSVDSTVEQVWIFKTIWNSTSKPAN